MNLERSRFGLKRKPQRPVRLARPVKRREVAAKPADRPLPLGGGFHLRTLRRAWRQFHQGSLSHWITTTIIALALTIFSIFSLLLANADTLIGQWQGNNAMTIFLNRTLSLRDAEALQQKLADHLKRTDLGLIPPATAMERMKKMLGTQAGVLEELEENPLPYSLEFALSGKESESPAQLAEEITHWSGVEAVSYDRQWAERLAAVVQLFRYIGSALALLLLTAVALIVSNTIKLTIIARREEMEVMRFMGATDAFIKIPFIYEGMLQGFFGALLALLFTTALYMGGREVILDLGATFGLGLSVHFLPVMQLLFIPAMGIALGLFGALISLSRFLEV